MTTLVTRLADRLLSALAPEVQAEAVDCYRIARSCERCSTTRARLWETYRCSDGSTKYVDNGCGSC